LLHESRQLEVSRGAVNLLSHDWADRMQLRKSIALDKDAAAGANPTPRLVAFTCPRP